MPDAPKISVSRASWAGLGSLRFGATSPIGEKQEFVDAIACCLLGFVGHSDG